MKKKLLICIALVLCLSLVGCGKKEEKKEVPTDWELTPVSLNSNISNEIMNKYNVAFNNYDSKYEALSYLGSQVVAGTNYMFLVKTEDNKYKVVIIYEDLEGSLSVTREDAFDLVKYTKENISGVQTPLVSEWAVNTSTINKNSEEETLIGHFEEAVQYYAVVEYTPLYLLGQKDNYYVILALEKVEAEDPTYSMKILTINAGEKEAKVEYNSFLNLADYN